jgi:DNA-binding XRE family transcriptional regulator
MPPAQVQELVAETKAWYEAHKHDTRQRDLAEKLGVSPTGLCQIFAGKNAPSASTALAMIRFLEENNMKTTTYLDPRATPRQAAGNPGPKTLTEARDLISELQLQILELKAAAVTPPAKPALGAPTTPLPVAMPTTPAAATPTAWEKEIERARLARMEGLSNKPLAQQTVRELQVALNNAKPEDQATIYLELKSRQGDGAMRAYRAGRR